MLELKEAEVFIIEETLQSTQIFPVQEKLSTTIDIDASYAILIDDIQG